MIVGICGINQRQYCTGVWANIEAVRADLKDSYEVRPMDLDYATDPLWEDQLARGAVAIYIAEPTSINREVFAGDEDGFMLYEYRDQFPGLCPFDED